MKTSKKKWSDAVTKAKTKLGKKAKIPEPNTDPLELIAAANKALDDLNKSREAVTKQIEAYKDSLDEIKNGLTSYKAKIAKADFGLNAKDPDDKKKLDQARKTLSDGVDGILDKCKSGHDGVDDLDKELENEIE
jgi:chromosome segregation ATPase